MNVRSVSSVAHRPEPRSSDTPTPSDTSTPGNTSPQGNTSTPGPSRRRRRTRPGRSCETERREERTAELLRRGRDQDLSETERQQAQDLAVQINLPIADSLARRYRSRGEDVDDLVQVARLGLVQAVHRFDPDSGPFMAFAVPTITGEIKRHFRDHCWTVRPPRRLQELHSEVAAAWSELAQEKASSPTPAEIAEWIGADRADVLEAIRSNAFRSSSLDTDDGMSRATSVVGTDDPAFDDVDDDLERQDLLRRVDVACRRLSDDERRLVRLRFAEGLSQSAIAEQLNVSQMSISRRLRKVTHRLRAEAARVPSASPVRRSMERRMDGVPRQPARA